MMDEITVDRFIELSKESIIDMLKDEYSILTMVNDVTTINVISYLGGTQGLFYYGNSIYISVLLENMNKLVIKEYSEKCEYSFIKVEQKSYFKSNGKKKRYGEK